MITTSVNVIRCKRTGEGLATKLGGGLCVCKTTEQCCLKPPVKAEKERDV